MTALANVCYFFAAICYLPFLVYQMVVQKKNRSGWRQRFGHIPARASRGECIWIHAVSLGEINATRTLVDELRRQCPNAELVISTTTDTGTARARQLYPDLKIFRFPLDFSWIIRRVLDRIRPTLIVLMELEVWYNLVALAKRRDIRICIANGRLTEHSARRMHPFRFLLRRMFESLDWVGAQTDEIAARFRAMGTPIDRVEVVGSLKWDTALVTDTVEGSESLAEALGLRTDKPILIAGSTGPGEEELLISAWKILPQNRLESQLVLVPRKPERFDEVARLVQRLGMHCIRRSEQPDGSRQPNHASGERIWLGDTMGELRKFYALADLVIVGRTFVPLGGSDPMEPAALGKPIVVGLHSDNFSDPVDKLQSAGALIQCENENRLTEVLLGILEDEKMRHEMCLRARQAVRENQGATALTVSRLLGLRQAATRIK